MSKPKLLPPMSEVDVDPSYLKAARKRISPKAKRRRGRKKTSQENVRSPKARSVEHSPSEAFSRLPVEVDLPPAEELLKPDAAARQLTLAGEHYQTLRAGHRERLYAILGHVFGVASVLKNDEDAWLSLIRNNKWDDLRKRPKPKHRTDALRYALQFVIPGSGSGRSRKVSEYYQALNPLFQKDVAATKIPQLLRRKGIKKRSRPSSKAEKADTPGEEPSGMSRGENEKGTHGQEPLPTSNTARAFTSEKSNVQPMPDDLFIRIPAGKVARKLQNDGQGKRRTIRFTNSGQNGKMIEASDVEFKKRRSPK
ncbi:hypothetical protein FJU11_16825 [Pararhizobium mangrovi]|uniref:Uncharacterized protein n=2 Tax=Pararhizobium mangrovi TaxID=2590452 RepID=A0A506TWW3_9HYPH|nr:hypothetical protein FJU11_16825 [Pararhizobium mangrovi]